MTPITAVILTLDEAPNLRRTLSALAWVPRIVVVDSGSQDATREIAEGFPQVEFLVRPFDAHASQWNYGIDQVTAGWCLTLDADYVVPPATAEEMQAAVQRGAVDGYDVSLRYCVHGKPLRASILPPRLMLFKKECGRYVQDGHTQLLELQGRRGKLRGEVLHDDRKSLRRWLWAQDRYADLEAAKLRSMGPAKLALADRIRRLKVVAPWLVPAYYLLGRGGLLDGWTGIDYAAQRAIAELVLTLKLIDQGRADGD